MKSNWTMPLVIVCLLAATCLARPPKVIKMIPENGAVDVKPGPNKIRILFDQDMNRGGYSICGSGENFPEFIGKPKWTGKRSIVINVNLKPNHEYSFGINSPSFKNFRSVSGEPAEVMVVTFRTAGEDGDAGNQNTVSSSSKAPKVIKITPENGDFDVSPGQIKISILFDKDMNRGGYSICGGGENFPEIIGKPKWTGKRSFVMNVKLKPNHEYTFGINSPSFKNFKSVSGEPAEVMVVTFRTCGPDGSEKSAKPTAAAGDNRKAVQTLRDNIRLNYSYRDRKGLDWDAVFVKYEQKLLEADSPKTFASIAKLLLSKAEDKHIFLKVNDETIGTYSKPVLPNANFQRLPEIVPHFKKHNNLICSGRFNDGIGYILIDSWSNQDETVFDEFYVALNDLSDAAGLIIDVRGNGGGSETLARQVAGCFIEKSKLYAKNINIDLNRPGQFTPILERYVQPNKSRPKYRGKVAVLTGPVVMSSCEAFVLMMKQVPGCVIVGETTQGCSGNPKPYDLGNGVTVYLPCWQAMLPDGTCFEGKGIQPDIPVKTTPDRITTSDPVINAARKALTRK